MFRRAALTLMLISVVASHGFAQTNALWHEEKTKNYLPHMSWPEVRDLLTRSDIALIPVPSIEQHGPQTPMGTDYYIGVEEAKLIGQRTDVLVAPVLLAGQSPYHMEFPGTITLSSQTIQQVYFEAAQSLIRHGFRRFLFLNSHMGNQYITRFVVDRINQETAAVALELGDAVATMRAGPGSAAATDKFDRHGGVGETSLAMYLFPSLVQIDKAQPTTLTLPPDLTRMLPDVVRGDQAATLIFLAEALKPKETGKRTSTSEMSATGVWSQRDPHEASAEQGRRASETFVEGAVRVIERWKTLRPLSRP